MSDERLKAYFKFDDTDLQANRSGQFTEAQKARLVKEDKSDRRGGVIGGVFLLLIAAVGLVIAVAAGIANPDWGFRLSFGRGFGVVWPLIWGGLGVAVLSRAFAKFQVTLPCRYTCTELQVR